MGLIRSGYTQLTPEDDNELTDYLWPVVCEIIKTAIENKQNLVVEGCYIPFNWSKHFKKEYLDYIEYYCLIMSVNYIRNHFADIKRYANDNENSMFFHTLYAYTEVLGYPALLKLRVEELYYHGNSGTGTLRRNYILQNIEEELVSESNRLSRPNHSETNSSMNSISDLFKLVKNYDTEFTPKPVNEAFIENGKPKVFYHGTASKFFEFDKNMGGINTNAQSAKKAFFFTSSQKVAGGYAEDARPKEIMDLYHKAEHLDNRAPFTGEYDAAEKQRESDTPRTLHAVVNDGEDSNANVQLSDNRVAQKAQSVNSNSM